VLTEDIEVKDPAMLLPLACSVTGTWGTKTGIDGE